MKTKQLLWLEKMKKMLFWFSLEKYNEFIRNIKNTEYLNKIDKAFKQVDEKKVVVKSIEELEAMTDE